MTSKPLSEQNLAELNLQRSRLLGIIIAFAIIWVLMLAFNIYLVIAKKLSVAMISTSTGLIPALIPLLIYLSKVNAEIKLRNADI